ncbi:unnamed protein product [Hymenolepis diminuta]|uniref:cyclin-dependent kinase n=1 Tax=Hymenolepis diminuta TaxID=6216 RepID=A0A0R3SJA9_HYMDI|nr:unnamed protein product [Hymenolepis diminuta]
MSRLCSIENLNAKYIKKEIIGSGTYGTVFRAQDKITGKRFDNGIPASTMREIGVLIELNQFNHPNIVEIHEIIHQDRNISIVFECIDWDLKKYMDSLKKSGYKPRGNSVGGLPLPLVKAFTRQLLDALRFCHKYKIIHRDIKPSNLLITKHGVLKLADFGLSRTHSIGNRTYCHEIVTLWYRAPEIILGSKVYSTAIDIWSTGCIAYEMYTGNILFQGDCEIDQLFKIFQRLGTPRVDEWPDLENMPDYNEEFPQFTPKPFGRELSREFQSFLKEIINLNPDHRAQAYELRHAPFLHGAKIIPVE